MTTNNNNSRGFSLDSFLIPLLKRPRIAQAIKRTVYFLLVINWIAFIVDDYQAFKSSLVFVTAPWSEVIESFSTTIDMSAWMGLVFMFELETYSLPDEAFKPWLTRTLHAIRLLCYLSLSLAAYSYTADAIDNYDMNEIAGVSDLCQLADQGVSLQTNSIDYSDITADNCKTLSSDTRFFTPQGLTSVIGESTVKHIQWIDWIGVLNAVVWVIVVALIEIELRMQSAGHFGDKTIILVRRAMTILYGILIMNGLIWLVNGYPLWAWDAFLWIAGFWAIELNMVEWEKDHQQEMAASQGETAS